MLSTLLLASVAGSRLVLTGATVYDGLSTPPRRVDVAIIGEQISEIGQLKPKPGDYRINLRGLVLAPGFIDAHSHASGGIFADPLAESQIRQGITTAVVGQDGGSEQSIEAFRIRINTLRPSLNFATFAGHGSIRQQILGDANRAPTSAELRKMTDAMHEAMRAGALGLSSGLEYVPGRYAQTDELIALAKVAAQYDGLYISHLRNEDNSVFQAVDELLQISKQAKISAQISHIKLGSSRVWGQASTVLNRMRLASSSARRITADVYPYTYWQSTIRVLIPSEEYGNRALWEAGLRDVGGAERVRVARYSPNLAWQGKTLAELAAQTGQDPIRVAQQIVRETSDRRGQESVMVTAMDETDLVTFLRDPIVGICSDGSIAGSHPRGAGSFPRVISRYVFGQKVIPLGEAIRKMTSQTARTFRLSKRGMLKVGFAADLVAFDPKQLVDRATIDNPTAMSEGMVHVIVNGQFALRDGKLAKGRSGRFIPREQKSKP